MLTTLKRRGLWVEVNLVRWDSMRPASVSWRFLSVIANDIGSVMKWLMVMLGWIRHVRRRGDIDWSLVVHLWRVMVHSQSQANMMSIVVCLWWYVIVTTVWICVVCIWLLSLRVFFVLHATVLEPENGEKDIKLEFVVTFSLCVVFTIFWLDAPSNSSFSPAPNVSASTHKRWTEIPFRVQVFGTLNKVCASFGRWRLDLAIPKGSMASPIQFLTIQWSLNLERYFRINLQAFLWPLVAFLLVTMI